MRVVQPRVVAVEVRVVHFCLYPEGTSNRIGRM